MSLSTFFSFWQIVDFFGAYVDAIVCFCTLVSAIETNLYFQAYHSDHLLSNFDYLFNNVFSLLCLHLMMSASQILPGIVKKRLTGNQRKKYRSNQASMLGITGSELLFLRRAKIEQWQIEKSSFINLRCPNCGAAGHSFKWCPFANDFHSRLDNGTRFRGPNGSWGSEPPLELSLEERRRFDQHFRFLTKPLYLKPNETTLYFAQTAGGGKNGLGSLGGVQSPNPTSSIAFGAHNNDNFSTQKR